MFSLISKIVLILILAVLSYFSIGKPNLYFKIIIILIGLVAVISIIVNVLDYEKQLKADSEVKNLTNELKASREIQESQLSELKALRHETNLLQDIGKTQLKATFYTEELNQKIGKVIFRIKLNKKMLFQDLCPLGFLFEINTISNERLKYKSFIENGEVRGDGGKGLMMENYLIYQVQDNGRCIGGHQIGHFTTEVENIVIELDFPLDAGLMKDFHDEKLHVWLPENILNQASFIELVVNGWAILHRDIDKSDWSKVNISSMWPEFKYKNIKLYENWKEDKTLQPYAGWKIDLYSNMPTKHLPGTSRWAGF
jgi:hypothetical protein